VFGEVFLQSGLGEWLTWRLRSPSCLLPTGGSHAREDKPMRHIREALRLVYQQGLSRIKQARPWHSRTTVQEWTSGSSPAGCHWRKRCQLSDEDLESHLFPRERVPNGRYSLWRRTSAQQRGGVTVEGHGIVIWEICCEGIVLNIELIL